MIIKLCTRVKIGAISVVTQFTYRGFTALPRNTNVKCATNLSYQKKNQAHHSSRLRKPKSHQLKAGPVYAQASSICSHSKESSSDESFCLQLQVQHNQVEGKKIPNPVHHITNLAYRLRLCVIIEICTCEQD